MAACGTLWQPVAPELGPLLETLQPGRQAGQAGQAGRTGRAGRAGRQGRQAGRKASRQVGRQAD